MTNVLQAVAVSVLLTNAAVHYPKISVAVGCPDGVTGCLVFH